jgi:hypothetical protein
MDMAESTVVYYAYDEKNLYFAYPSALVRNSPPLLG